MILANCHNFPLEFQHQIRLKSRMQNLRLRISQSLCQSRLHIHRQKYRQERSRLHIHRQKYRQERSRLQMILALHLVSPFSPQV